MDRVIFVADFIACTFVCTIEFPFQMQNVWEEREMYGMAFYF